MSGNERLDETAADTERTVAIGDRTYKVAEFDSESKMVLAHVDMTDTHIRDLEARLSIARTARAKYIQSLKQSLQNR